MRYGGFFDTHAHYDDERFAPDLDEILARQRQNGVAGIITCGSDLENSVRASQLAEQYDFIYATVGVHPQAAAALPDDWLEQLTALAARRKVVAIGEIGLDYYYPEPGRDIQRAVFRDQLKLAGQLGLPVQIHDRDAHGDIFELVDEFRPSGCLHRFSASPELAREYVKRGLYLGIGGALTYQNAKKERAVVEQTPLESLLLETDCPYLAPAPFRGQRSTSDMLWTVAELIGEIKGIDPQAVVDATRQNARRAFGVE